MLRRELRVLTLLIAGAMMAIVGGCSDDDDPAGPEEPTDEEVLEAIVTGGDAGGDAFSDYFDLESTLGELPFGAPRLPIHRAPIDLGRWFRDPQRPFTHAITVEIEGDEATVHASTTINGTLNLFTAGETPVEINKDLTDVATRDAEFHRYPDSTRVYRGGWRLERISNVEVESPGATVGIDSVIIFPLGSDGAPIVITDPLELLDRDDIPHFGTQDSVDIRVYTGGPGSVAYLHTGRGSFRRRVELDAIPFVAPVYGKTQVFAGTLVIPTSPGIYQAALDLIHEPTLYDDDETLYPYNANTWMIIYRAVTAGPGK